MIVAIHQPNIFPWLGYFNKIFRSDVFVFLDDSINNRKEGSYIRRVKLLDRQGKEFYITIPINKIEGSDFGPINAWKINTSVPNFPQKILRTVEMNYNKHEFFNQVYPLIEQFFTNEATNLSERNILFIKSISKMLEFDTKFILSSSLNSDKASTARLVDIVKKVNGNIYLSGKGGDNYQDESIFLENDISLQRQNFSHFQYPQMNASLFISGLSIVDCLMNIGFEHTSEFLKVRN